jgi:Cu2+-exporting ATPase
MRLAEAEARSAARARCAHCGLAVPTGLLEEGTERQFCCAGCRSVWSLIHEHGLDRYYALREDHPAAPAPSSARRYEELDDPGFQARACRATPDGLSTTELYLEGVHCSACVWLVERLPRLLPGVAETRLDLPRSQVLVRWDPAAVSLSAVARQLSALGYTPHPARGADARALRLGEDRAMLARMGLAGAVAGNVMAIAFALYAGMFDDMEPEFASFFRWASLGLAVPSVIWGGGVFVRGAFTALRAGALSMDLPISIGLLAGFLHSAINTVRGAGEVYFDSVTALIFLLLVGRYLQRRQQRAAGEAAELAASLHPSSARLIERGRAREVPLEALVPGAVVEVRAGDLVPADGVVIAGRSGLDVSLLSGEPAPVAVAPGDPVHAGTVNVSSRIEVRVEQTGEDTRVGRLMKLVEEHARRRAPIAMLADRISGHFVGAVLTLAAATVALWWRADPVLAIDHAVALLIVTCPCALGLATPLALSSAIGQAARAGFLIKGADVVEKLTRPGRMWLDKTGTLTEGRAALVRWTGDESAKGLVAAAEAHSSHPLARAFLAALGEPARGARVEILETHGGGIEARVGDRSVVVGAPAFVGSRVAAGRGEIRRGSLAPGAGGPGAGGAGGGRALAGDGPPGTGRAGESRARAVEALTAQGLTPVLVAIDGQVVAAAGFGDPVRADAAAALDRVRALGWRLGILSGDHPRVVAAVGSGLGLASDQCHGGVTPEEKLRVVAEDAARGPVVMAGDGVNDAAALAAAGVGIAVHGGAEAALAAADVFVTRPGVARIAELCEGSRRAMWVVKRNLLFSLGYNVVGVALAMAGLLNPLVAAILMPLSSITVIVSSYRSRTFPTRGQATAR